jgi:hypothetical protein
MARAEISVRPLRADEYPAWRDEEIADHARRAGCTSRWAMSSETLAPATR